MLYECGCLFAYGRGYEGQPDERCDLHRTRVAHRMERQTGFLGLEGPEHERRYEVREKAMFLAGFSPSWKIEGEKLRDIGRHALGTLVDAVRLQTVGGRERA